MVPQEEAPEVPLAEAVGRGRRPSAAGLTCCAGSPRGMSVTAVLQERCLCLVLLCPVVSLFSWLISLFFDSSELVSSILMKLVLFVWFEFGSCDLILFGVPLILLGLKM